MEIIAHRGASHAAPENTVAAAQLAWAEGADALEFDVRLTADGRLVAIHDENTERVAGVARSVDQSTLAVLKTLDVGRWKDARHAGEKIPTLEEMLATVPAGKRAFIEVKGGQETIPPLARCLQNLSLTPQQAVVISFDFAAVVAAKKALPHHEIAWILDYRANAAIPPLEEIIVQCRAAGIDALDLSASWPLEAATVAQLRRAGLKLYVWTVDDPVLARRLADAGIDGITTNRPGSLRRQLTR